MTWSGQAESAAEKSMLRTLRHVRGRCANEGGRDSGQHYEGGGRREQH